MSRSILAVLVALAALAPSSLVAQAPRSVSLFPHQAAIEEPSGAYGLVRLPLSPEVLSGAAADLGDVRVHDESGHEVPYAIDRGDRATPSAPTGRARVVIAYEANESRVVEGGVMRTRETYRVRTPGAPGYGGTWELILEPEAEGELVRQIVVRAEPAFGESREVARGSIFRFARWGNARLSIPLPGVGDEPLFIELWGEGAALHPRLSVREIDRSVIRPATAEVSLPVRESRREGTASIVVVERPRGLRTEAVVLGTTTASFVRNAAVRAPSPAGTEVLGRGGLVRVAGLDVPELREIAIAEGGGDVLEIVIEDGDSPPLTELTVTARVRVPSLLFDSGLATTLRWGGHRARAPRYDLMSTDLAALVEGRPLLPATLGPVEPNPDHDDTPALAFAMRPGSVVDRARLTHRAPLTVPASHDGLSRFSIPPAMWAVAREDLADLRVVDGEARQWPYVLVAASGVDELAVEVSPAVPHESIPHRSIHRLSLPASAVSPTTIRVELGPQLVARSVSARGRDARGEEVELGVGNFLSNEDAPARLELSLFGERVEELWLEVDDGDEAPLAIERVTLVQPAHAAQLVAPAGAYTVLVGDPDASSPSYDVANAYELLAVLEAEPAILGALETSPDFHEPSFFERSGWETVVLSLVLGLVVLVLFGLTLRIARSESGPSPTPAHEASAPATEPAEPASPTGEASEPAPSISEPGDGGSDVSGEASPPSAAAPEPDAVISEASTVTPEPADDRSGT